MRIFLCSCFILAASFVYPISTQTTLDIDTIIPIDSTRVTLYKSIEQDHFYNYVAHKLYVSKNENNEPEISLIYIKNDEDSLKLEGAILHFLISWGIEYTAIDRLEKLIKENIDSLAILAGSMEFDLMDNYDKPQIIGDTPLSNLLKNSLKSASNVPLTQGAKCAMSFYFNPMQTEELKKYLVDLEMLKHTHLQVVLKHMSLGNQKLLTRNIIFEENMFHLFKNLLM